MKCIQYKLPHTIHKNYAAGASLVSLQQIPPFCQLKINYIPVIKDCSLNWNFFGVLNFIIRLLPSTDIILQLVL